MPEPAESAEADLKLERYARQMRYAPIGETGQRQLAAARALICGCGALGSMLAALLARAGIGRLRIVDRDFLELNNLQRQMLYDEADVAAALPKAIAAANQLRRINSSIEIEPVVADVTAANVIELCAGVDLVLDGTDNFETRFLVNEAALKLKLPWVYGGAIGTSGQTMTILPGEAPCLRCLISESPPPGTMPTCDTAEVLGPIIGVVASIQACEAIKILSGNRAATSRSLTVIDLWENRIREVGLDRLRERGCPTCRDADYPWLTGRSGSQTAILCGRNAVQIRPAAGSISLEALAEKLSAAGQVTRNPYLLRLAVDDYLLTIFPDGRAIIGGTDDIAVARTLYAKYVGL
jgi:molybdopterin-synthase adenylyltransferase